MGTGAGTMAGGGGTGIGNALNGIGNGIGSAVSGIGTGIGNKLSQVGGILVLAIIGYMVFKKKPEKRKSSSHSWA